MTDLRIQRPDDWHVHLRDGAALKDVVKFTAERFGQMMQDRLLVVRPGALSETSATSPPSPIFVLRQACAVAG